MSSDILLLGYNLTTEPGGARGFVCEKFLLDEVDVGRNKAVGQGIQERPCSGFQIIVGR